MKHLKKTPCCYVVVAAVQDGGDDDFDDNVFNVCVLLLCVFVFVCFYC